MQERPDSTSEPWTTRYERNGAGLLLRIVDHLGSTTLRQRVDRAGRVVQRSHQDAATVTLSSTRPATPSPNGAASGPFRTYDELNRITALRYADPAAAHAGGVRLRRRQRREPARPARPGERRLRQRRVLVLAMRAAARKRRPSPIGPARPTTCPTPTTRWAGPASVTYPDGTVVGLRYDAAGRPVGVDGVVDDVDFDPSGMCPGLCSPTGSRRPTTTASSPGG